MDDSEPGGGSLSPRAEDRSLEGVLDEHAELRDLAARIQEAADLPMLGGLLVRLHALLETHFGREEASGGILQEIGGDRARPLIDEHRGLLAAVRDLVQRVELDTNRPVTTVQGEVAAFLARLERHDSRETDLIDEHAGVERSAPPERGTRSKALEVNLRRTAVDVVIPAEQRVLLDLTSNRYGVHENTKRMLREVNHPYVNWSRTLEDLHRRAMGDFAHYVRHERVAEAVEVFCKFYVEAAAEAFSPSLRDSAIRDHLSYLEKVARESEGQLPSILPALERALERLDATFAREPRLARAGSPRLRRVAEALLAAAPASADGALQRSFELLSTSLERVYEHWLELEDPADWWRELAGAGPDAAPPERVAAISHARLKECRRVLGSPGVARKNADVLLALPDDAQIARDYLDAAGCVESETNEPWQNQLERIRWLIKVLAVEALASVHEQALSEINHSYVDVLRGSDRLGLELLVHEIFGSLRHSELSSSPTALNLIAKIGEEVLNTRDPAWSELVIGEMLDWDFPTPEFSGFTDEWHVQVNPAHLRAIRTYLTVIEADAQLARPLIAALVVHLKIGGVFIADTDLFQKDVSRLLNSEIGPVYHQIKHLLKIFPVYFRDIGAEGELREVSSRIDEVEGRRDPLCHFLRKQSHVESNPLLIGFIEAIGHFWATGEREPLLPYVPTSLFERIDIDNEEYAGLRPVFARLVGSEDIGVLFDLEPQEFERRLKEISEGRAVDREKAALLFRLRKLIGQKYELDHDDLLDRLRGFHRISDDQVEALRDALDEQRHEAALETLLSILEHLKEVIVSEEPTEGVEDIYYKRHIAVGIPSMYGRYREEKFDAVGLTFRIESLANALFERMISEHTIEYVTRNTLRKAVRWLRLMLRALRIDGCMGRGLSTGIAMLDQALMAEGISVDQYVNIFQFLSHSVEQVIRIRFLEVYESVLERLLRGMLERGVVPAEQGSDEQETILKVSEGFLRDLISQSFGLQQLDNLVGRILRTLAQGREQFDRDTQKLLMTYDADRCFVPIEGPLGPHDGAIYLGNKGYMLKRLVHEGLPVPHGFIISTEVFRCREAIRACGELQREIEQQVAKHVHRLERLTGHRFGDPSRPLLLSVRSGSTMSMPGVLDTFLDVGMNEAVAEGFAAASTP
jgi:pyruvate,orthophosphate dikinase